MAPCRLAGLRSRLAEEQGRPESGMGWEPSERRDRQDQELSEGERRQGREREALPMGERAMVRSRPGPMQEGGHRGFPARSTAEGWVCRGFDGLGDAFLEGLERGRFRFDATGQ